MTRDTWYFEQIEIDVTGFFTTHHRFETDSGVCASLTFPAFSDHSACRMADGRELVMRKVRWLGSAHELIDGEVTRGTADRSGLFRSEIAIRFDGQKYVLEPEGCLRQGWYLVDQAGNMLLEIQPRGILRQGAFLTVMAPVDAALVAFAYYLVYTRQQEDAAAVAATSAAASS